MSGWLADSCDLGVAGPLPQHFTCPTSKLGLKLMSVGPQAVLNREQGARNLCCEKIIRSTPQNARSCFVGLRQNSRIAAANGPK